MSSPKRGSPDNGPHYAPFSQCRCSPDASSPGLSPLSCSLRGTSAMSCRLVSPAPGPHPALKLCGLRAVQPSPRIHHPPCGAGALLSRTAVGPHPRHQGTPVALPAEPAGIGHVSLFRPAGPPARGPERHCCEWRLQRAPRGPSCPLAGARSGEAAPSCLGTRCLPCCPVGSTEANWRWVS